MVTIKSGKADGSPVKLVVTDGLTREEKNLFLDHVPGADFYREYILLPVDTQDLKGVIKSIMISKIDQDRIYTTGHVFTSGSALLNKVNECTKYSQLAQLHNDYKNPFSL